MARFHAEGLRGLQISTLTICRLQNARTHLDVVTDRLWRTWWQPYGETLESVQSALSAVLDAKEFPFTLVALLEGQFAGTVTAIDSDIFERPELSPCLAALWVEDWARGKGVARALVAEVTMRLRQLEHHTVYLSAKPPLQAFYERLGWQIIEQNVGLELLTIFSRDLPLSSSHDKTS
ncbi:GNAT family N-acetyltransferase [Devosia sp. MC1541]|uniref:GNAT family N-acetyltransferase n=1 Tax=Devosia sp. MC1541 TaxID=2725264 RepID=UPI00145D5F91